MKTIKCKFTVPMTFEFKCPHCKASQQHTQAVDINDTAMEHLTARCLKDSCGKEIKVKMKCN